MFEAAQLTMARLAASPQLHTAEQALAIYHQMKLTARVLNAQCEYDDAYEFATSLEGVAQGGGRAQDGEDTQS